MSCIVIVGKETLKVIETTQVKTLKSQVSLYHGEWSVVDRLSTHIFRWSHVSLECDLGQI